MTSYRIGNDPNVTRSQGSPCELRGWPYILRGWRVVLAACLIFVFGCAGCGGSSPSSHAAAYNQANSRYVEGDYAGAAELYSDLVRSGVSNGFLFYNLGNAYFKQGEVGRAILWYTRARNMLPRDRDVATNLEFARKVRPDKIDHPPLLPVFRAIRSAVLGLNLSELTLGTFLFYLLSVIALVLYIPKRMPLRKVTGRVSVVLGVALVLCVIWLGARIYHENHSAACVILAAQVNAMSGPGDDYTKVMSLHEGTEAEVVEERGNWYLIKLPNGVGGWIPANTAELI